MIDRGILNNYATYSPAKITSLEDLIPYGALRKDWFDEKLANGAGPYSVHYIQESEKSNYELDPWEYHINSYNFRDSWDFKSERSRIGFFGCSFTFGEGIKSEDTFVQTVGSSLNLNTFNFGSGGSSVERVARTFSAVTRLIDLDLAVITLPGWHRQLHVGEKGDMINLIPAYPHSGYEKLCRTLTSLDEDFYSVRAASSINWIYDIATYKGIKILFSSWDHSLNYFCSQILPKNTLQPFPNIDDKQARDKMHPGSRSQKAHAKQIIEAVNDRAWV